MERKAGGVSSYKNLAVKLAADDQRLLFYRNNLRDKLQNSQLNIDTHVNNFETAIWEIWHIKSSVNQQQGANQQC
jgi:predicted O-linked N-acetylglucosamine transferase (SPINDLY family)